MVQKLANGGGWCIRDDSSSAARTSTRQGDAFQEDAGRFSVVLDSVTQNNSFIAPYKNIVSRIYYALVRSNGITERVETF